MCICTCSLWWMCNLWVGQVRRNACVMSCEPPLSLPSQLLPPSLLFLQKTQRQVLYSLLAMRWHHPVVYHIVHDVPCAALCWREPAVLSLCVPWSHSVLSFNPLLAKQVCMRQICAHMEENTQTQTHTLSNWCFLGPHWPIRQKAHLITCHSDLPLPPFIPHKQAWDCQRT